MVVLLAAYRPDNGHIKQSVQTQTTNGSADVPPGAAATDMQFPFMANGGLTDERVSFFARTFGGTVFLTATGEIVYSLPMADHGPGSTMAGCALQQDVEHHDGLALREELVGGKIGELHGEGQTASTISYFTGSNPEHWRRGVPSYNSISFGEVYDGIGFAMRAHGNNVEKLFYIEPGATVGDIRLRVSGTGGLRVNDEGELEVETQLGLVTFTKPVAYQDDRGIFESVDVAYAVSGDEYGFTVGDYDPSRALVIDPLLASTFIGGSARDGLYETPLLRDEYGNIYVAGRTSSADFPVSIGVYDEDYNGGYLDIFVAKFNPSLTTLLAATFLGGSSDEGKWPGVATAMDEYGNIFVAGKTNSTDFPTTSGAYQETHPATDADAFIAKLSGDLTTLMAATYLGGSQNEYYITIASDRAGHVYLAGATGSADFPVTTGVIDGSYNGDAGGPYPADVFLAKLDDDLTTLLAAAYLGGTANDYPEDVELDQGGNVYLTGWTNSSTFPTSPGSYAPSYRGGSYDAFVSRINGDFTTLVASTYLGGNKWDFGYALALDADNNVYVSGHTASSSTTLGFPTTIGAYDQIYADGSVGVEGVNDDVFVSKFDGNLTTLLSSTFLGGTGWENGTAITVDGGGNVIVAGATKDGGFPCTADAHDPSYNGLEDGFISRLDGDLQTMTASTHLGGSENECIGSIVSDDDNVVYVAGITGSADFPTTALAYGEWAYDETYNGPAEPSWGEDRGGDVFITRIDLDWAVQDNDGDGYLNQDDNCPYVFNVPNDDADFDGVGDPCDNCPTTYNPEQEDINFNWIGDSCEVPETWYVQADGSGEAPTIQAAIDSTTHGDTVLVADGVYTGEGNWVLDFRGRHIILRAENGPQLAIIDCQGSSASPRRAFTFENGEDSTFIVDGFTIRNGYGPAYNYTSSGGAMFFNITSPTIKNCVFIGNEAAAGGALYAYRGKPKLINCSFAGNSATVGSALFLNASSIVAPDKCLVAFNAGGQPVYSTSGSSATCACCDVYGNAGGDWVGAIAGQNGINGNFSADPLCCNVDIGDIGLADESSPCLPANNSCAVLIGALGLGCTCNCGFAGDMDCSGNTTPVDVAFLVKFVYLSLNALCPAPNCPYAIGDLDCNGQVTPLDMAYLVNAVYKSQNAICNGCLP
jgi:hypothetical protein